MFRQNWIWLSQYIKNLKIICRYFCVSKKSNFKWTLLVFLFVLFFCFILIEKKSQILSLLATNVFEYQQTQNLTLMIQILSIGIFTITQSGAGNVNKILIDYS